MGAFFISGLDKIIHVNFFDGFIFKYVNLGEA